MRGQGPTHPGTSGPGTAETAGSESALIQALRQGDEAAFERLVSRYYPQMLRIAMIYVSSRAVAEEVVQEAWVGVLRGIDRFEERSSLKTWIFRILTNTAKTRGLRESRSVPFSEAWDAGLEQDEPAVDPDRFLGADHHQYPRHWSTDGKPQTWGEDPEARLLSAETLGYIRQAIMLLPPNQRQVITLRDIEGWSAEEVCEALKLSDANQRVLLHRARSKVRRAVEHYVTGS